MSLKESDAWPAEVLKFYFLVDKSQKMYSDLIKDNFFFLCVECSLKMLMAWRSWPPKNCASITTRILGLSVVLDGSITYMAHLEHGKVYSCLLLWHS